mgnify:CR=1 FL=1
MGRFSLHHNVFLAEALFQVAHKRGVQVAGRADELAGIKHADADVVLFSLEHIEDFAEDRHLRPVNRRQAQIERLPRPLLLLLGTPEEMLDMASDYLFIIMLGITGMAFYAILSGVLRGLGDSVSPLIYLLIASLLNIVLDIAFITLLGMTTDGVAWATIIAQGVSAIAQPGGSIRDYEVVQACNEAAPQVAMVFTGQRSFKH